MNDKLQDAITDLIKNGTDFVTGQVPDVVQQLLSWETTKLYAALAIEAVFVAGLGGLAVFGWRYAIREDEDGLFAPLMIVTGFCFLALLIGISDAFELAKVLTAPKVWLLEYAAQFVKK